MTTAQQEAWTKATDLLREHFDSAVCIVETACDDCNDELFDMMWQGGLSTAIGLVNRAYVRLCSISQDRKPN